ncbi:hypothetical protein LSTR_LSTR002853 [Laodelphax striatellus]|uniref:EF-hand domain-containing protein n=1 Tax=Laodelphax striatellus TaxID=195883 RepID=A0A482XIR2_LAOST|nr:hypothetical protein LSTR_LSTR002853 [Laodelphax striatellus]
MDIKLIGLAIFLAKFYSLQAAKPDGKYSFGLFDLDGDGVISADDINELTECTSQRTELFRQSFTSTRDRDMRGDNRIRMIFLHQAAGSSLHSSEKNTQGEIATPEHSNMINNN